MHALAVVSNRYYNTGFPIMLSELKTIESQK